MPSQSPVITVDGPSGAGKKVPWYVTCPDKLGFSSSRLRCDLSRTGPAYSHIVDTESENPLCSLLLTSMLLQFIAEEIAWLRLSWKVKMCLVNFVKKKLAWQLQK